MATELKATFETGPKGSAVGTTAGGDAFHGAGGFIYDDTHVASGSLAAKWPVTGTDQGSTVSQVRWTPTTPPAVGASGHLRGYFWLDNLPPVAPAAGAGDFNLLQISAAAGYAARLGLSSLANLRYQTPSGYGPASSITYPVGQLVRAELFCKPSSDSINGAVRALLFAAHSLTPLWDSGLTQGASGAPINTSTTVNQLTAITAGKLSGTTHTGSAWMDDVAFRYGTDVTYAAWPSVITNAAPTAAPVGVVQQVIKVTANASDSDGSIATYLWEVTAWPGATKPSFANPAAAATTLDVLQVGAHTIKLTATDNGSQSVVKTFTVNVAATGTSSDSYVYNGTTWVAA